MEKQACIDAARADAIKGGIIIGVCDAPIEQRSMNEFDDSGPFMYAPLDAVHILYKLGTVVAIVKADGTVVDVNPPYPCREAK